MRSGCPSALVKVTAPSTNVPLGVCLVANEVNSALGFTVTVTVALEAAGTVTESSEKVRSIPLPVQFVECLVYREPLMLSESACPPSV